MLKNFWYIAGQTRDITRVPKKVILLGKELIAYRDSRGQPLVFDNRCPHRGAELTQGQIEGDCVRCPYHGWQFNSHGDCVEIPSNTPRDGIPPLARLRKYSVQERYGWLWVYLADLADDQRPPLPEYPLFDADGWRAVHGTFYWNNHYSQVMDNAVDMAHTAFVHKKTFANPAMVPDYRIVKNAWSAAATIPHEPRPPKGIWKLFHGQRKTLTVTLEFHMPNIVCMTTDAGAIRFCLIVVHTPVNEHETISHWLMIRNFLRIRPGDWDCAYRVQKILREDKAILESMGSVAVPLSLSSQPHARADQLALAYRRYRKRFVDMGWKMDEPEASRKESRLPKKASR
ncbi:MAG TPA: aromatic ring-hydroxylating dioxygenase subunit alpha [Oligoflexus sp.]|uniref:aromatic ring-hydroxylating dioxygenase subunit alpha n=1 Tax=Oligoflexus sp. TaxID=1971216 RepID=UPI002D498901|nr:aromatic ring-hydroxylating dioxygenase subunit alpha [Oligoflexus sp.]HYX34880.1 aromatic ring-hydroxylating dioxygenase subunit alpha [Oligoflexus sp.]